MAFVKRDPGAERVGAALTEGVVSAVIFAETLSKLAHQGFDALSIGGDMEAVGLTVAPVGPDDLPSVVALI
jgi:hypothetical protein